MKTKTKLTMQLTLAAALLATAGLGMATTTTTQLAFNPNATYLSDNPLTWGSVKGGYSSTGGVLYVDALGWNNSTNQECILSHDEVSFRITDKDPTTSLPITLQYTAQPQGHGNAVSLGYLVWASATYSLPNPPSKDVLTENGPYRGGSPKHIGETVYPYHMTNADGSNVTVLTALNSSTYQWTVGQPGVMLNPCQAPA